MLILHSLEDFPKSIYPGDEIRYKIWSSGIAPNQDWSESKARSIAQGMKAEFQRADLGLETMLKTQKFA